MIESADKVQEAAHYWRALTANTALSEQQQLEFQQWLHAQPEHTIAYAEAELVWHSLGEQDVKMELQTLLPTNESNCTNWLTKFVPFWPSSNHWWLGAALSCVCLAAIYVFFQNVATQPPTTQIVNKAAEIYQTNTGEHIEVRLTDGSVVTLDAESKMSVSFTTSRRAVTLLAGNAFFAVETDLTRPFVVSSGAVNVTVTGTEFEVQRKTGLVYVAVEEGQVEVSQPFPTWADKNATNDSPWQASGHAMLSKRSLSAGQAVTASRQMGLGKQTQVELPTLGAWRSGKLVYANAPLWQIIADLNRYHDKNISFDHSLRDLKLSGTFSTKNIDSMLEMIQMALPVKLEYTPQNIRFSMPDPS